MSDTLEMGSVRNSLEHVARTDSPLLELDVLRQSLDDVDPEDTDVVMLDAPESEPSTALALSPVRFDTVPLRSDSVPSDSVQFASVPLRSDSVSVRAPETRRAAPTPLTSLSTASLHFALNWGLIALVFYLILTAIKTFSADVDLKISEYSNAALTEISRCAAEYVNNDCRPDRRPPAIEDQCNRWDTCMNRDPLAIGRSKVNAETFAEIIDTFVSRFSGRTLLVISALCVAAMSGGRLALDRLRSRKID